MARRAAEVHQPAFGQQEDRCGRVVERVAIDLRLDVDLLGLAGLDLAFEPGDVDLDIEVADVADDGVVLHLLRCARRG